MILKLNGATATAVTLGDLIKVKKPDDTYYIIVDDCRRLIGCGGEDKMLPLADKIVKEFKLGEKELFVEVMGE